MKVILPPSETKRPGGDGVAVAVGSLALPSLRPQREATLDALVALSHDEVRGRRVLRLGPRHHQELLHNREVRTSATMPAVDRYAGVLFDALGAHELDAAARGWLSRHVWIHSALWGPVAASDPLPVYRFSAGLALPGIPPLRRHWADATTTAIASAAPTFVLDLRSESYAALGPLPKGSDSVYVRVVTDDDGPARALNHFNKRAKGLLVRALACSAARIDAVSDLQRWCHAAGVRLRESAADGEVQLVVREGAIGL